MMSDKSWRERDESTIARSWSKLLSLPDVPESEGTDTSSIEIDAIMDEPHVPTEERSDWLMLENNDKGYHEYTDEEIVANVTKRIEEIDEEDDDVITQDVTHAQACEALETVLAYLEQQPDKPFGTNVIVNSLLNHTAMKRVHSLKQSRALVTIL